MTTHPTAIEAESSMCFDALPAGNPGDSQDRESTRGKHRYPGRGEHASVIMKPPGDRNSKNRDRLYPHEACAQRRAAGLPRHPATKHSELTVDRAPRQSSPQLRATRSCSSQKPYETPSSWMNQIGPLPVVANSAWCSFLRASSADGGNRLPVTMTRLFTFS